MLGTELTDKETLLIGQIIAQWAFLEGDIYYQVFQSYSESEPLHKSMKNAHFSEIIELWKDRVIGKKKSRKMREILKGKYDQIKTLYDFRNAIAHSAWDWDKSSADKIKTMRVHGGKIKQVTFTASDLANFAQKLGEIRYCVRYPGGEYERVKELMASGGYMSRRFLHGLWEDIIEPSAPPIKPR